jgi:hypothetical protein
MLSSIRGGGVHAKIWKTQNSLPFSSVRKMDYKNFGQNLMFHGWNNMILFLLALNGLLCKFLGRN